MRTQCHERNEIFLPGDEINVESIVEDDEDHALVRQEDQPLPAQTVQIIDNVSEGHCDHQDRRCHLVHQKPQRGHSFQQKSFVFP